MIKDPENGSNDLKTQALLTAGIPINWHRFVRASCISKRKIVSYSRLLVFNAADVSFQLRKPRSKGALTITSPEISQILSGITTPQAREAIRKKNVLDAYDEIMSRSLSIVTESGCIDIEILSGPQGLDMSDQSATQLRDGIAQLMSTLAECSEGSPPLPSPDEPPPPPLHGSPPKTESTSPMKMKPEESDTPRTVKAKTFRNRRLSLNLLSQKSFGNIDSPDKKKDSSDMMNEEETGNQSSFIKNTVSTLSCHGIEPVLSRVGGITRKAKINQDRGAFEYPFAGRKNAAWFCVMDGHGRSGEKISEFAINKLPELLTQHPCLFTDPGRALEESFLKTDDLLREHLGVIAATAGTTCVACLLVDDHLTIANVGDSRAVLGSISPSTNKLTSKDLSNDHKPDTPGEKKRIVKQGGFVSPGSFAGGPSRAWKDRRMTGCGLAMARSLGDQDLGRVGVIAKPEITQHDLKPKDKYMVLASDGVFEFISSKDTLNITHGCFMEDADQDSAKTACERLIQKSATAWKVNEGDYRDDITVVVVHFPCIPKKGELGDREEIKDSAIVALEECREETGVSDALDDETTCWSTKTE